MSEPEEIIDAVVGELAYEKGFARAEGAGERRSDTGGGRPGAFFDEPLVRQNGLCGLRARQTGAARTLCS